MERYLLAVEGFTVTLELKRMHTLRLRVRPEGIFLSAPFGTPRARLSEFVRENAAWLRRALERVERRKRAMQAEVPLSREEIKAFADDFKPRFERWQEAMGLRATRVTFKLMKSRWGSCNPATRRISINVRLCRLLGARGEIYPSQTSTDQDAARTALNKRLFKNNSTIRKCP